jgi:hypothetical protein
VLQASAQRIEPAFPGDIRDSAPVASDLAVIIDSWTFSGDQRAVGAAGIGFRGAHATQERLLRHPDFNGMATPGDFRSLPSRGLVRLDLSAEALEQIA